MNGDLGAGALWDPLTVAATRVPAPLTFRAASPRAAAERSLADLDAAILRLGPQSVLAFVMEPIGGQASGVNVPDPSFARGARALCDRYGIALVFDEVVTALRTGAFLAAHHDPLARPDLVTMAKGLGAGYVPLGAVLTCSAVADELADSTGFVVSHSYDACPMACAAGAAVLDEVADRDLVARSATLGERLRAGLERIAQESPVVGDVRGRGLLQAVELVADRATAARFGPDDDPGAVLLSRGREHGLLLYSRRQNAGRFGDWLLVAPPLIIDEGTVDLLLERLHAVLTIEPRQLAG
jgi:adenosylmethionine-8-amino-7-oxononanoate aminotransferase